jgi:hypothetical protein
MIIAMKLPRVIIAVLLVCVCPSAWCIDTTHPMLSIEFSQEVSSTRLFISVFEVRSKRLLKVPPPAIERMVATHSFVLPSDLSGDCVVFIDPEITTIGSQCHRINCKNGERSTIKAHVGESLLAIKFPPSVKAAVDSGADIDVCLFHLTDQGIDPLFLESDDVRPENAQSMTLYLCGVQAGRYVLTVLDAGSSQPLYSRVIDLSPKNIRLDLWPFSSGEAPSTKIEFEQKDEFRGLAAALPTNRGPWWNTLWIVSEDGSAEQIDVQHVDISKSSGPSKP